MLLAIPLRALLWPISMMLRMSMLSVLLRLVHFPEGMHAEC